MVEKWGAGAERYFLWTRVQQSQRNKLNCNVNHKLSHFLSVQYPALTLHLIVTYWECSPLLGPRAIPNNPFLPQTMSLATTSNSKTPQQHACNARALSFWSMALQMITDQKLPECECVCVFAVTQSTQCIAKDGWTNHLALLQSPSLRDMMFPLPLQSKPPRATV